jgi:flagellin-like hook-associated protein FlgL
VFDQEFQQLKDYIIDTTAKEFNSVPLFDGQDIAVTIDSEGDTFDMAGIDMTAPKYVDALIKSDQLLTSVSVAAASDTFTTSVAHGYTTGDIVQIDGANIPAPTVGSDDDSQTEYYVLVLSPTTFTLHTGTPAAAGNKVDVTVDMTDISVLGPSAATPQTLGTITRGVHIKTALQSDAALTLVKTAISQVAQDRAALGAVQSRLNFTNEQLSVTKENLSSALKHIADVDVAEEATQYARYQILVQSGTSMLQQANQLPNAALQLLRG